MQINILAVGEKTPSWVEDGVNAYISRMPHECSVKITTVATTKRSKKTPIKQAQQREQELLLKLSPKNCFRIALDENGTEWSTVDLAERLKSWMQESPNIILYIGGPDGFTQTFLKQVDMVWSLSKLTMPHMLVRLILAEQLYRAWTILQGHPYHRQ